MEKSCQLNICLIVAGCCIFVWLFGVFLGLVDFVCLFGLNADWLPVNLENTLFACYCEIYDLSSSFSSSIHLQMDTLTMRQEEFHLLKWEYLGL